jgi:acylphosphatase
MRNVAIHISGEVYKVGFRYYLKQMAGIFHIKGYVKYRKDRSLQVEARGEAEDIDRFVGCCRLGCISATVHDVVLKELPPKDFENFEVIDNQPANQ